MNALIVFLMLQLAVVVHELGHYLAALAVGVKPKEVMLGLGPRIFRWGKGRTRLAVRALLVGGGLDFDDDEYSALRPWQKAALSLSGPAASFLGAWLGVFLAGIVYGFASSLVLGKFNLAGVPGAVAKSAEVATWIMGEIVRLSIGAYREVVAGSATPALVGPVGMMFMVAKAGTISVAVWAALFTAVNIAVGLFNLLPFPPLDGGRALLALVDFRESWQRRLSGIGVVMLLVLLMVLTVGDVVDLLRGG